MRILCVGMMVCDTLISPVPYDILTLDSVGINKPSVCCGGDALNTAIGLAKLGTGVSIIGRIADDISGRFILKECEKYGVEISKVVYDTECATAVSYALIDEKGERHFLSEKSVFANLNGGDVSDEAIKEADIVYIGSAMALREMDKGGIRDVFHRAHSFGKMPVMDAAVNREDPERNWLSYLTPAFMETDIFFPSMGEAMKITGKTDPRQIAESFRKFGMKMFGIKMGEKGCFVTDFNENRQIECPKGLPVVDTTGAGDSFMAGLMCGLTKEMDVFSAAEFGSCVATKNVGAIGGTAGIPTYEEAFDFYQSFHTK